MIGCWWSFFRTIFCIGALLSSQDSAAITVLGVLDPKHLSIVSAVRTILRCQVQIRRKRVWAVRGVACEPRNCFLGSLPLSCNYLRSWTAKPFYFRLKTLIKCCFVLWRKQVTARKLWNAIRSRTLDTLGAIVMLTLCLSHFSAI